MGEPDQADYHENPDVRVEAPAEAPRRRRRKSRQGSRARTARKRLRFVYFVLASCWGFMTGTAAVLAGLAAVGGPMRLPQPMTGLLLAGAGLLAVVGGFVAAVAYHEASKRL